MDQHPDTARSRRKAALESGWRPTSILEGTARVHHPGAFKPRSWVWMERHTPVSKDSVDAKARARQVDRKPSDPMRLVRQLRIDSQLRNQPE